MDVYDIVMLIGQEFEDVDEDTVKQWVELVKPMVSKKQFGKLYEQAVAYLVCHKLKMSGEGANPMGKELGNINSLGFAFSSVSEGGSSISFGASQGSNISKDAEYGLTSYGMQYLELRRMCIVPIHISGQETL